MAQSIGDVFVSIGARFEKLEKGLNTATNKIEKGFDKLTPKLDKQFVNLGKTFAAAFAVREIINFGNEVIKLAAEAEGVERAFKRLGDPELLEDLKEATRGTVSELELMRASVNASNLGVPIQNLASLFEFATQRAADTGESVDHLVQSIVVGIGRKSPLILDNLGISAIALKEALGGVGLEAASVGDIAEAVGKIASKSMEDIGETTLTAGQEMARTQAKIDDLKVAIGNGLTPAYLGLLEATNQVIQRTSDFGSTEYSGWTKFVNFIALSGNPALVGYAESLKAIDKSQEEALTSSGAYTKQQYEAANAAFDASKGVFQLNETVEDLNTSLVKGSEEWKTYLQGLKQAEKDAKDVESTLNRVGKEVEGIMNFQASGDSRDVLGAGGFGDGALQPIAEIDEEGLPFEDLEKYNQHLQKTEMLFGLAQQASNAFGQGLVMAFQSAIEGSMSFFQAMGQFIIRLLAQLAAAIASALILNSLLAGIPALGGGAAGLAGGATGTGSMALDIIGQISGGVINLASNRGGRTNSRTIGR